MLAMLPILIVLGALVATLVFLRRRHPDRSMSARDSARVLLAALGPGLVAGFLAGGIGSRLAMKIVAVAAGPAHAGELTDAEAVVGKFTGEGTGFLLFAGTLMGMFGGFFYFIVRRWMPGTGVKKGLAFGVFLIAVVGHPLISGDNIDFVKFTSPFLAVGLFMAIYIAFGLIVSPLSERLLPPAEELPAGSALITWGYVVLAALAVFGLVRLSIALQQIFAVRY